MKFYDYIGWAVLIMLVVSIFMKSTTANSSLIDVKVVTVADSKSLKKIIEENARIGYHVVEVTSVPVHITLNGNCVNEMTVIFEK